MVTKHYRMLYTTKQHPVNVKRQKVIFHVCWILDKKYYREFKSDVIQIPGAS